MVRGWRYSSRKMARTGRYVTLTDERPYQERAPWLLIRFRAVHKFRFGVSGSRPTRQEWQELARKAEDLGFSTLLLPDHFGRQLAPLPALQAAAAATTTLRVGTIVLDNDFRHPVMLAKDAATLDLMTDGRFELGIGAGWSAADYRAT